MEHDCPAAVVCNSDMTSIVGQLSNLLLVAYQSSGYFVETPL